MAQPDHESLRGAAGTEDPQTFTRLDCEDIKAQGFLCLGSLLRDTQPELLSCYLVIAPRLIFFKYPDSGSPGLSQ